MRRRVYTQEEYQALRREQGALGLLLLAGVDLICLTVNLLPRPVRSFMMWVLFSLLAALVAFLLHVFFRVEVRSWEEIKYRITLSTIQASDTPPVAVSGTLIPEKESIKDKIHRIAPKHGLDPLLVYAVITQESAHAIDAISRKGATGLMQVMPATAKKECGLDEEELKDPDKNIECGCHYLRKQIHKFGQLSFALAAYNAGPTATTKYKRERGTIPPYPETQKYVRRILDHYNRLSLDASKMGDQQTDQSGRK